MVSITACHSGKIINQYCLCLLKHFISLGQEFLFFVFGSDQIFSRVLFQYSLRILEMINYFFSHIRFYENNKIHFRKSTKHNNMIKKKDQYLEL